MPAARIYLPILFIVFFLNAYTAKSQLQNDSLIYTASLNNVSDMFKLNMNENMHLYEGGEYVFSNHGIHGLPFFESDTFQVANIWYNNMEYTNIPALYDLYLNKLIIKDYTGQFFINLLYKKIDSFSLNGRLFIKLDSAATDRFSFKPGFYQQLYTSNNISLFATHEKVQDNYISEGVSQVKYVQYDYYFIEKNKVFYKVQDENDLLDILNDKKNLLQKYIKNNRLNFKKNFESALIKTVAYYSDIK